MGHPAAGRRRRAMSIYLPIAEVPLDVLVLLAMGGGVGFRSGMFGVGGGFLITPMLIFLGVSPAVAAATGAAIVIAPSVSSVLAHWRRRNVDLKMGMLLTAGGLVGSAASVALVGVLRRAGLLDVTVSLSYVLLLGIVGTLMLGEVIKALRRRLSAAGAVPPARRTHFWVHGLPGKMRFPRSRLYVSALLPLGVGLFVGIMSGVMGVGGGFFLVPVMIYLIGMPTSVVIGTSLLQVIVVAANVTLLQAWSHQTVDIVLAATVMIGGLLGAPYGAQAGARLKADQLRGLMALLILAVAIQLGVGLVAAPDDLYSIDINGVPEGGESPP
jgi:uncharacterized membrane protein YfcA